MSDLIRFFRRNWLLIMGSAVVSAVAAAVLLGFFDEPEYEASATLVVTPPRFASELKPRALSVQGYQRLLESDAVIGEMNRRLVEEGVISAQDALQVGTSLESRIFVSRRAEETILAPIIEAMVVRQDPEQAAKVANTWVDVFLVQSRSLVEGNIAPLVDFIEASYSSKKVVLEDLEKQRTDAANQYQENKNRLESRWDETISRRTVEHRRTLEELTSEWDRKLVEYRIATEDLATRYQSETRRVLEEYAAEQLASLQPEGVEAGVPRPVQGALRKLVSLRTQLAQVPDLVVLRKSISEDALWQAVTLSQSELFEIRAPKDQNLLTQELNPVYAEVALRVSEVEASLELLEDDHVPSVQAFVGGLEQQQRARAAGLAKLLAERAQGFDELERDMEISLLEERENQELVMSKLELQKERELDELSREHERRIAQLEREITHDRDAFDQLASNYRQALLARAEQNLADVRLGSAALPPRRPEPRLIALKSLIAFFLGGGVGLFAAVTREVSRD